MKPCIDQKKPPRTFVQGGQVQGGGASSDAPTVLRKGGNAAPVQTKIGGAHSGFKQQLDQKVRLPLTG
jgi:hypothetical protein